MQLSGQLSACAHVACCLCEQLSLCTVCNTAQPHRTAVSVDAVTDSSRDGVKIQGLATVPARWTARRDDNMEPLQK